MNDKFRYFIVPSAIYTLEWSDDQKMDVKGEEILAAMWDKYRVDFYLGEGEDA